MTVLEQRGVDIPDEARERITGCADLETLRMWLTRAVTAGSVEEIFASEQRAVAALPIVDGATLV